MENTLMKTDGDDANGPGFKEQAVKEIQLGLRTLSLDKVPRSPKNPNALKPRKDVQFRSGGNTSSSRKVPIVDPLKVMKVLKDIKTWADLKKYMAIDDDMEGVVIASVDKRDMDEAIARKEEPDELYFRSSERLRREAHEYATAAISYMRKKGHNLELVKPCLFNTGVTARGLRIHFNFKAKRADDPNAPVETYFGQLRLHEDPTTVVECCVSLGASDSLPYERDNRGCRYCDKYVHHPEGGCKGIIWGRPIWSPQLKRRNNDLCASKDVDNITDERVNISGITSCDRKRPHESCLNPIEAEFSPNKKQAVQSPMSKPNSTLVEKPTKMNATPRGFPLTVKCLTSTGILDGVPIKYISTSGEEFNGIIKGTGYLCGCEACKFSKVVKADEFERHAGYQTKHPNCRIYFENGKTIYRVVQKLRSTPDYLLFENIESATGSPINQKAFSAWKDSFQSASNNLMQTVNEVDESKCKE